MNTGAVIIASRVTSQEDRFQPMKKIGSVSAVQRLIETFSQAGVEHIVLVATKQSFGLLEKHVIRRGVICLCNEDETHYQMIDFAKIGLAYLEDKCDQILLTPVDIPLFTACTVQHLIQSGAPLASPVFEKKPGHPLLISKNLVPLLLKYEGENGLHGAIKSCGCSRTLVEVDDGGVLYNIELSGNYQELLEKYNQKSLHPSIKLRLVKEQVFFGPGAAQLLSLIETNNSVRLACQQMGISYSKAWKIIRVMEDQIGETVVDRQQGGKNGGTAFLTVKGKNLLEKYQIFEKRCQGMVKQVFEEIFLKDDSIHTADNTKYTTKL